MPDSDYLVPAGRGEAEHTDKKSRFLGQVSPVSSESEAMAFIESVSRKYADATHNVWAYLLRSGSMRWSDDGEPGGTAGRPVLSVFLSGGISDVCCVVTRWFGGILLGSGGLVRAYSKAAAAALESAGTARMELLSCLRIECGYPQYERARRLLEDFGAHDINADFAERVSISALLSADDTELFSNRLTDITAGAAAAEITGQKYAPEKNFSKK